ncbi:MAG: tRNA (guanosine(37)-N1)-methyltransferase TrmD [bacterium]|nr:tRNA (guanosine(37)-N1)-methyltransferase TrmD [bacterium]
MRCDVVTIFPELFDPFFSESLIKRASRKKLLSFKAHDLRKWVKDKHRTVDDRPFGGGLGQVFKLEPLSRAVQALKKEKKTKVILLSPRGKKFTQTVAAELAQEDQLIFLCGRYEGVDERVAQHIADLNLSLGDFVLMGGEVAAMAIIETVARLVPGVVGKEEFLKERVPGRSKRNTQGFWEFPQYTRPEVFEAKGGEKWRVPRVLMSGNHKEIAKWRARHGKVIGR